MNFNEGLFLVDLKAHTRGITSSPVLQPFIQERLPPSAVTFFKSHRTPATLFLNFFFFGWRGTMKRMLVMLRALEMQV